MNTQNVVVLGASPREDRYSNKAVRELVHHNYNVYPIHPLSPDIHGKKCYKHLDNVPCQVDTLTLYVGAARSTPLIENILAIKPSRIIMNPGAENDLLETKAKEHNIEVVRGCTLVMLNTGQF
ncbi:CoA-binding protein [Candidatus Parabeggiatoa sp. HSG14]|uniref:CoA-binding protein n=1 Tax=Candidatus Parabeggiatoa sp. HSG14 TaxID=3055593 RepID=UPI0025A888D5|nr:CoA-binding protein [Thiotrichales bacterium HSG14]